MKRNVALCLGVALVLVATHRAPAPIVEETPTPAATAKPRPRATTAPKSTPRPTVKPDPAPISYAGVWDTNFNNELQMSQTGNHVIGTYDASRGVLDATVSGNVLVGTWTWKGQTGVCRFTLSRDGKNFIGTFNASNGRSGAWTGIRRSP
jgi:hypothetical protein